MDKFGIFKLLNSFLDLYSKNSQNSFSETTQNTKQFSTGSEVGSPSVSDLLSSLLGKNNKPSERQQPNTGTQNSVPATKPQIVNNAFPPLKDKMLYTMNAHDEFVKKVTTKNK